MKTHNDSILYCVTIANTQIKWMTESRIITIIYHCHSFVVDNFDRTIDSPTRSIEYQSFPQLYNVFSIAQACNIALTVLEQRCSSSNMKNSYDCMHGILSFILLINAGVRRRITKTLNLPWRQNKLRDGCRYWKWKSKLKFFQFLWKYPINGRIETDSRNLFSISLFSNKLLD